MTKVQFPFLCAQRSISEACDWLDDINAPQETRSAWSKENALYAGQTWLCHAITTLQSSQPIIYAEGVFSIKDDAEIAAQMLKGFLSEVLGTEPSPSIFTSGLIIAIRGFLELNFPGALKYEREHQIDCHEEEAKRIPGWLDSR